MERITSYFAVKNAVNELINICHAAWQRNLLDGWSGNASMRIPDADAVVITAAGTPKGSLREDDFLLVSLKGDIIAGGKKPSSEIGMHLGIYQAADCCQAILHTHPTYLQAAEIILNSKGADEEEKFLNISLYEAAMWRKRLIFAQAFQPGSVDLARSVQNELAKAFQTGMAIPCAVWLKKHGLCAIGDNLRDCLCITEELEHIAHAQILSGC